MFGLPAPLIAWSMVALVSTPIVFLDARRRGNDRALLWGAATLLTFGHAGLLYLLERDDPGDRQRDGGEYLLPGQQSADEPPSETSNSETGS
jgi:hypothetical protein